MTEHLDKTMKTKADVILDVLIDQMIKDRINKKKVMYWKGKVKVVAEITLREEE